MLTVNSLTDDSYSLSLESTGSRTGNSGGTREPSSQEEFGFAESFFDFEVFAEFNSKNVSEITAKIIWFA